MAELNLFPLHNKMYYTAVQLRDITNKHTQCAGQVQNQSCTGNIIFSIMYIVCICFSFLDRHGFPNNNESGSEVLTYQME